MKRLAVRTTVLGIGLAVAMAACGESPDGGAVGDEAPELSAVTLDGDSVSLAGLRGEVVLLNVWATWCVPCRKEVPELESIHETYADQGLRVVGVTVDHRGAEAEIRQFMDRFGMTYDVWWDPDGTVIDAFGAVGVPLTVLLDRDGTIAWRHLGTFNADNPALRNAVRATL